MGLQKVRLQLRKRAYRAIARLHKYFETINSSLLTFVYAVKHRDSSPECFTAITVNLGIEGLINCNVRCQDTTADAVRRFERWPICFELEAISQLFRVAGGLARNIS
jgi:hypothetical protein